MLNKLFLTAVAIAMAVVLRPTTDLRTVEANPSTFLVITGLSSTAESITLPGELETGEITTTLDTATSLKGPFDLTTGTGTLLWPVITDFPLLGDLGLDPIETVSVGPFILDAPNESLIAFDISYMDHPVLGEAYSSNHNNVNVKTLPPPPNPTCGDKFGGLLETTLKQAFPITRAMMDDAMDSLQAFDPSVPPLDSAVLDTIFSMYSSDPNTELVIYFPASDSYFTSNLTQLEIDLTVACPAGAVGGIAELPDMAGTPLEAPGSSGPSAGVLAGAIAGAVVAGGITLGGAAWYARRRLVK